MKSKPKITPLENDILLELTRRGQMDWLYLGREEVKALRRLVKKGYAIEEKNGRGAVWRPIVPRQEVKH